MENRKRDLALFNLAIDGKLRGLFQLTPVLLLLVIPRRRMLKQ
jgi:hypothetical protein